MNNRIILILVAVVAVVALAWMFMRPAGDEMEEGTAAEAGSSERATAEDRMSKLVESTKDDTIAKIGQPIKLTPEEAAMISDPENTLVMQLSTGGPVIIETLPDKAPHHVARFKELARQGFFDGIVFHRVIDGFMAQTGDPTGTGSGGSGQNLVAEFNDTPHVRGVVSTARSADPNSGDSQFFIMYDAAPHLDGNYTAWGRVISGMDYVDALAKGSPDNNGVVPQSDRDRILTMQVAADVMGATSNAGDSGDEGAAAEESGE